MSDSQNKERPSQNGHKAYSALFSGAVAGAVSKTSIAPFDRTKINFQITKKQFSFRESFRFIQQSYHENGFFSLWRGNTATLVRIVPYSSIQFSAHEWLKHFLEVDTYHQRIAKPKTSFSAGALAGVVSTTCTYPLDLARARMAVTQKEMYSSLRHILSDIWRTEGPHCLYRGYIPTILGVVPYSGTCFFTYETLKMLHAEHYKDHHSLHPLERMLFGATAGLLGQSSSYPLDIVRRRMQTARLTGNTYYTIYSTCHKILMEEGVKGLYKGLSLNWIKGPIAVGLSFTTFDFMQSFIASKKF